MDNEVSQLQKAMISYEVHPEVITSENLIFKDDNHSRKYASFNEKSTIALCAIDNAGGHGTNKTVQWFRKM